MKIELEEISSTRQKLTVDITPEHLKAERAKLVSQFVANAKIPGFRPGKAPASMIEKRFKTSIDKELHSTIAASAFKKAAKEEDRKIYNVVKFEDSELDIDGGGKIAFTVDLQPEFELPAYNGITLSAPSGTPTQEQIDEEKRNFCNYQTKFEETDDASLPDDYVEISFVGTINGQLIEFPAPTVATDNDEEADQDSPEAQNADSQLQPNLVDNDFAYVRLSDDPTADLNFMQSALLGKKKGDVVTLSHTFAPDDARLPESARGQPVDYTITVKRVRKAIVPEFDDEFAHSLGLNSASELEERITDRLTERLTQHRNAVIQNRIRDYLVDQTSFNVPQSAVDLESNRIIHETMSRYGIEPTEKDIQRFIDEHGDNLAARAEQVVRSEFILLKIASTEKLPLNQRQISKVLVREAQIRGSSPDALAKSLSKNDEIKSELQQRAFVEAALDYVAEKANINDERSPDSEIIPENAPAEVISNDD